MTDADREMLVRIDENVTALKKVVFGNGRPGLASRMDKIEEQHRICYESLSREKNIKPAKTGNIIALCALVVAIASPFIVIMLT